MAIAAMVLTAAFFKSNNNQIEVKLTLFTFFNIVSKIVPFKEKT